MIIEEKLGLSNGRFLTRKRYKQFCAILLYIRDKFMYNFIAKICQTSNACLRSCSDYILLTSAWGTQQEFPDYQQNICNPQLILFSKTSGSSTRSQNSELQAWSAQFREIAGIWRPLQAWIIHDSLEEAIKHSLSTTTGRTIFQGGDREYFFMALRKKNLVIYWLVCWNLRRRLQIKHEI